MNYQHDRLKQILAAEYVLGTLHGGARRRFARLLETRGDLRAEVRYWEARFAPLLARVTPVVPRAIVWTELERRALSTVTPLASRTAPVPARKALWLWQGWAVAASAAVVALSLQLYQRTRQTPLTPPPVEAPAKPLVAMLAVQNGAAAWAVSVYPQRGEIQVVASGDFVADAQHESMELWLIGDDGKPRSLGLMPLQGRGTMPMPAGLKMPARPILAVSREPHGGSPTGLPTGPVLATSPVVAL